MDKETIIILSDGSQCKLTPERDIPEEEIPLYLTELRARSAKMQRYKVYHRHNPSVFVMVNNNGYFPLEIKSKAIKSSDLFDQSEWSKLAVKRIDQ